MSQTAVSYKLQRLALVNVCLGQFISALDSRSVTVALPTISIYFNSSMALVQWIPLAYQLTVIGFVLSMARLGDMLGRKKIYALGFLLLTMGSACSGLSTGMWQLITFRVLAGIGGAVIMGNGRAIVSTVYAQEGRGPALGLTSMAFHLGYIIGPSLGGFLIDTVGWRWIFFVNLPVAAAAALMAWKVLPETVGERGKYSLDLMGMMTLLLTVVSLILGLQQIAKSGVTWFTVAAFPAAAIFLALLLNFERKSSGAAARSFAVQGTNAHRGSPEQSLHCHLPQRHIFPLAVLLAGYFAFYSDPSWSHDHFFLHGHCVPGAGRRMAWGPIRLTGALHRRLRPDGSQHACFVALGSGRGSHGGDHSTHDPGTGLVAFSGAQFERALRGGRGSPCRGGERDIPNVGQHRQRDGSCRRERSVSARAELLRLKRVGSAGLHAMGTKPWDFYKSIPKLLAHHRGVSRQRHRNFSDARRR